MADHIRFGEWNEDFGELYWWYVREFTIRDVCENIPSAGGTSNSISCFALHYDEKFYHPNRLNKNANEQISNKGRSDFTVATSPFRIGFWIKNGLTFDIRSLIVVPRERKITNQSYSPIMGWKWEYVFCYGTNSGTFLLGGFCWFLQVMWDVTYIEHDLLTNPHYDTFARLWIRISLASVVKSFQIKSVRNCSWHECQIGLLIFFLPARRCKAQIGIHIGNCAVIVIELPLRAIWNWIKFVFSHTHTHTITPTYRNYIFCLHHANQFIFEIQIAHILL